MKRARHEVKEPQDADARRTISPVICYPVDTLPRPDLSAYQAARDGWEKVDEVIVPPREASCFHVPAGSFFRIVSIEGPQVGDLNLWSADDVNATSPIRS